MASIKDVLQGGKIIAYRFTACVGRDARGKQVRKYTTWHPPDGLRQSRMRAAAERAAEEWEQDVRKQYAEELERLNRPDLSYIPPEERRDDFVNFVNDVWFRLYICNGDRKRTTEAYYEDTARYITDYFSGEVLQDITRCIYRNFLVLIFLILTIVNLPKVHYISDFAHAGRTEETPDSRQNALNRVFYLSVLSLTPSKTHFRKLKSAYRSKFLAMVLMTSSITMGFDRWPFIPASKDA